MKKLTFFGWILFSVSMFAQTDQGAVIPSPTLTAMDRWADFTEPPNSAFFIPVPPSEPVRHMAEWEELEAIVITWRSFEDVLIEIVRHAKEEVKVFIVVGNDNILQAAQAQLTSHGVTLDNIEFIVEDNDSVWVRDYGQTPVYSNEVGEMYFIDSTWK